LDGAFIGGYKKEKGCGTANYRAIKSETSISGKHRGAISKLKKKD